MTDSFIIVLTQNGVSGKDHHTESKLAKAKKEAIEILKMAYGRNNGKGDHSVALYSTKNEGVYTEQQIKVGFMQEYRVVKDKEIFSM